MGGRVNLFSPTFQGVPGAYSDQRHSVTLAWNTPKKCPFWLKEAERGWKSGATPLSVPFLLPTSGKGTDTATMLRLEKYGRIDFSLGRWATTDQNAPKSMKAHARESFGLARTFFRSLSWLWESLFWTWSCICCKTDQSCDFRFLSEPFHISQHQYFTHSSPTTVAVHSIVSQCVEDNGAKKRDFDQN